ncbi:MAG TPA: M67 family metallopeptidase [Anaerolineae bacterium]
MSQAQFDEMLAGARSDRAQEMCGLLAGRDGRVTRVLPVPNSLRSPVAYRMDGPEFVEAMKACDFEPLAIYHSHPHGPAVPSPTDVAEALYPDSIYVIISFVVEPPSVRAFRIVRGEVSEVGIKVDEGRMTKDE